MSKFWEQSEIRAKLSVLRNDACDALFEYMRTGSRCAADFYIVAQAKYTLACAEVKDDSILDYVEVE